MDTTKKLKVMFVIGTLDIGGTETQLVRLVGGLDSERFQPIVCCLSKLGPLAQVLTSTGTTVRSFDFRGLREGRGIVRNLFVAVLTLIHFYRFVRAEEPGIVHCMLFHAYVIGAVVARAARVPVVIASRRSLSHFKAGKPHYWFAERIVNRMTDLVIANSEAVRQDALIREKLTAEKVMVIHNGLDLGGFSAPYTGALREDLRIPAEASLVAVIANFIDYKGHDYFLGAWERVLERFPRSVALLIGDGPLRAQIEQDAAARGVEHSLRFLGTRQDVPALLALADLLVHPSLEEGFSNAIIEAMAAGKAVVATEVGGNPEAVEDGRTGLLVPPRDGDAIAAAIIRLLASPELRKSFGDAGRRRAEQLFSVDRLVAQYEQVYQDLAARKGLSSRRWRTDSSTH